MSSQLNISEDNKIVIYAVVIVAVFFLFILPCMEKQKIKENMSNCNPPNYKKGCHNGRCCRKVNGCKWCAICDDGYVNVGNCDLKKHCKNDSDCFRGECYCNLAGRNCTCETKWRISH